MARPGEVIIAGAVEGLVDQAVMRRLLGEVGAEPGPVYGGNGKDHLLERLDGYNRAARFNPWLVLVDLDRDDDCPPPFRERWLPHPAPRMCFRVAVRAIEAWLLADRERCARFLGVTVSRIPLEPESERDPKRVMVDLARHSRRRDIREDLVPRPGSGRAVGPAYTSRLMEFVESDWRPEVAANCSDSLRRCRQRLVQLVEGSR
jgi:hypothetical protein